MRTPLLPAVACLALLSDRASSAPAMNAPPLEVQTADGRVLTGVLDSRSDDHWLWLRQDQGPIALATSVAWTDLTAAAVAGQPVEIAQLQDHRSELASETTTSFATPANLPSTAAVALQPLARRIRVRNLEVLDACVVNLDRDVEPDGIAVSIVALGEDRLPVAVRGSLSASLFGERRPNDKPTVDFPELDRWSQPVRPTDFVDGIATYELRFRGAAPEWQFALMPDAVLDVRLGAVGHGNYAAASPVYIRPFNPLRDDRQQQRGTRFLPNELRGRYPSSAPTTRDGRWINWAW